MGVVLLIGIGIAAYKFSESFDKTVILNCLKSSQIEPKNAAMIGDRPLTDILAGQFAGTKTVLVDSITKNSEAKIVRFARFLERLTVRK